MTRFTAELWREPGDAGWYFVTLPPHVTDEVRARAAGRHNAFGSVRVEARISDVVWQTSLFSDTKRGAYLLPVKATVRKRAGVRIGDAIDAEFDLL